jgi:hypothetical protein
MIQPNKILLILLSSSQKKPGGTRVYSDTPTLALQGGLEDSALLAGRARVLELIKKGGKTGHGKKIMDLPNNRQLVNGPDLGGASREGRYLPAGERYQGPFFSQLGPDGPALLAEASSSVLILSGLYGVVTPAEAIQDYTCHFNDHPRIRETWTEPQLLSDFVLKYIQTRRIEKVFEFTALHSARYLLDWASIRKQVSGKVVHLFGERTRGEGSLTPLGALAKDFLTRSQADLLCLEPGQFVQTSAEGIYLHSRNQAAGGLPTEVAEEIRLFEACDDVVSMARNIRKIVQDREPGVDNGHAPANFDRIVSEKRVPSDVAGAMKNIVHWSEQIESGFTFTALQIPTDWLKGEYETVLKWATV